jgi:putative transposase
VRLDEVCPRPAASAAGVHKTANVLNKLPTSQQSKAKRALQKIWRAETKKMRSWRSMLSSHLGRQIRHGGRVPDPGSRRAAGVAAEHWKHLRTTNVVESEFRDRAPPHGALEGMSLNRTALAMIFKLSEVAENSWRRLNGHN